MKTIGLLGGMSWESTVTYYQLINLGVKEHLGGLHSAKCVLYSKVGLLGTKYTMTQDFYKERLTARGIEVLVPGEADTAVPLFDTTRIHAQKAVELALEE